MDKPFVSTGKDGSITLEWIHKDARMGICLEVDMDESSWYVISKRDGFWSKDGFLKDGNIKEIHALYLQELDFAKKNKEVDKA